MNDQQSLRNNAMQGASQVNAGQRFRWMLYTLIGLMAGFAALAYFGSGGSGMSPKQQVRERLKDPESAIFRGEFRSRKDSAVLCGEVNSRNGFGGMAGYMRFVSDSADGTVYFDNEPSAPNAGFAGKWAAYCR